MIEQVHKLYLIEEKDAQKLKNKEKFQRNIFNEKNQERRRIIEEHKVREK